MRRPSSADTESIPSRFRVVHIELGRHWVGGPNQVLSLCRGLHERGVDSWLLCPPESALYEKACSLDLNVRPLPSFGDLDPRLLFRARRLLRELNPDLVHLHSRRGADTWGALAARAAGVRKVILSRRVDDAPGSGPVRRLKYGAGCDHIIAISEEIRQVLLRWGVPPEKVTCVRSALDLTPYRRPVDPAAFRAQHGIPPDRPLVATMAQLIPRKGHRVLLDALPAVLARVPDALFLFCGEGADRPALERIVSERGLGESVRFMGFVQDIPALLSAADVVAHPALREGLGIALLEAMGVGKPVVASAVGGIPEAVGSEATGLLVPPGVASALADALLRLLEDPDLRKSIGAAAAERIRREFSVEGMVEGNLAVYRRVLGSDLVR